MTAWITKDALGMGIFKVLGNRMNCPCKCFIAAEGVFRSGEWHDTESGAKLAAEHMRVVALRKAEADVERLRKMTF